MTSTSTRLVAQVLQQPSSVDRLHWVSGDVPFRTAQDFAAAEYLYRLRLCSVQVRSSALQHSLSPLTTSAVSLSSSSSLSTPAHATGCGGASSSLLSYPVQVTAQLTYLGEALSPLMESAAAYASCLTPLPPSLSDASHPVDSAVTFRFADEWLIFSLELCDLPLDATCELHLWYKDTHIASAAFHVFSVQGELQVGQLHVQLHAPAAAAAPGEASEMNLCDAETAALLAEYHRGRLPVIPWLDALSVQQLEARQALQATSAALHNERTPSVGAAAAPPSITALLTLFLPTATTAVFHEPAVALASRDMEALRLGVPGMGDAGQEQQQQADGCAYTRQPFPDHYTFFKDVNLSEAKAAITSKSQYFVAESSAPPGPRERHQLSSLLRRPPIQLDHGSSSGGGAGGAVGVAGRLEETRLLWKYRNFICRDGKFLLPFMRSVDWSNTHSTERRAACALMRQWARPGFADVLACLSFYFNGVAPVRQYAVHLLRLESDGRVCQLAFQLLQALRYDSVEGELASFLLERAGTNWEVCSTLYTMLTVEVALERRRTAKGAADGAASGDGGPRRPASARDRSAARSPAAGAVFEPFLRRLADHLNSSHPTFVSRLRQQHAMHRVLLQLTKHLQQSSLDRLGRTTLGNKLIDKQSCGLQALFATVRHRDPHTSQGTGGGAEASVNAPSHGSLVADGDSESDAAVVTDERSVDAFASESNSVADSLPQRRGSTAADNALDRDGVVTLPIYPAVPITGVVPNSLYIFKSAKLPMRVTFKALRHHDTLECPSFSAVGAAAVAGAPSSAAASHPPPAESAGRDDFLSTPARPVPPPSQPANASAALMTPLAMQRGPAGQRSGGGVSRPLRGGSSHGAGGGGPAAAALQEVAADDPVGTAEELSVPLALMYKYDDDVRQDQLVVQLIRVMDELLQQEGLQLYLTPYRVIATGPSEGLVEIVPQVTTFLSVQRDVLRYLRVYNPTAELLRQAMDRYTRSFAGYCVITFVLGIGDRHLENILLTQDGRLLHIDFGYVFGNDPKPFPPPMKINREMLEVLGGPQSTGFNEFKLYCCSAYNILRKHAALLLHTLLLGANAEGMPQVTGEGGDPRVNLPKVQEKLRLDLTNAQATQYLQNVIADSVGSIFTNLWDVLHAGAQAMRS